MTQRDLTKKNSMSNKTKKSFYIKSDILSSKLYWNNCHKWPKENFKKKSFTCRHCSLSRVTPPNLPPEPNCTIPTVFFGLFRRIKKSPETEMPSTFLLPIAQKSLVRVCRVFYDTSCICNSPNSIYDTSSETDTVKNICNRIMHN